MGGLLDKILDWRDSVDERIGEGPRKAIGYVILALMGIAFIGFVIAMLGWQQAAVAVGIPLGAVFLMVLVTVLIE